MSRVAIPLLFVLVCGILPLVGYSAERDVAELKSKRAALLQYFGPNHPHVLALTADIKASDLRLPSINLCDAESRLVQLVQRRQQLNRYFDSKHPKVVENAVQIRAVADMLVR